MWIGWREAIFANRALVLGAADHRAGEYDRDTMRYTPHFLMTDPAEVKRLIRQNPWATFVSHTAAGLVASHYPVLTRLTNHFERGYPGGRSLAQDEERTRRLAKGAVGLRLTVTRFDARAKLSQNKKPQVVDRIVDEVESRHPSLGAEMRRIRARRDSAS